MAEDAARELPNLPLEDLLQLVHLYAERGSPKYERAARRWLERYWPKARQSSSTLRNSPATSRSASRETTNDDPDLASHLRIEERELEAGGLS